jgi:PAS domain S-box-containing protein
MGRPGFARWLVRLIVFVCLVGSSEGGAQHAPDTGLAPSAIVLPGLTPAERAWLQAHPVIRLGLNGVSPPWSYVVGGQYRGIHVDLIHRLSRDLGIRLEPVQGQAWDALLRGVDQGKTVDAVGLVPSTPEGATTMRFTEPLATVEYGLFVHEGTSRLTEVTDLVGHRVAVVGSFSVRRWLERDYPGVVIVPVESTIEALRRVSVGEVDGAVSTVAGASWLVREQGIVNLRVQQVLYRTALGLGVRRDWPELVTILNKAIAQIEPAEVDRITAAHVQVGPGGYTRQELLVGLALVVALVTVALVLQQRRALLRERRLAATLAQREREYRLLVDNSLDGVLRTTPEGRILAANPAACRMFGLSEQELRDGGRDRIVDDSDPRLAAFLREREAAGSARGGLTLRRGDGTLFEAELGSAVYAEAGGRIVTSMVIRDVSERHRAEARLRLMQACIEHLNDAIVVTEAEPLDEPGPRIVFVNAAFTRQSGYTAAEVIGRTPQFLLGPETDRAELRRVSAALRRRESVHSELLNYRKDGQPFWIEVQMVPIADATGAHTHWVAVERDVTPRRQAEAKRQQLEQQLRTSQKMEAIGTLAGGIAHDFNNILGAIVGHAAIAAGELRAPGGGQEVVAESFEQILRAADRARRLVQQILAFSRSDVPQAQAQAVEPVMRETVSLLRATLPATVMLDVSSAPGPLVVRVDPTQLQQVLLNLCTNAWQALPGGTGHIEVRVDAQLIGPDARPDLPPGPYVHFAVRDDGKGMDDATRERIFDPFFTTKLPGQGTGLGLAVVHGIVTSHGGTISVDSAVGRGTCVHVWLPQGDAAAAVGPDAAPAAVCETTPDGRGERVLYVDDDDVMRVMVGRLLPRLGYRATCVRDADEAQQALHAAAEAGACFDAVVTDYNMPGQNGVELARAVRERWPGVPVLLSSGYVHDGLRAEAGAAGVRETLHKEHTLEQLGPALQRALASGADPGGR